MSSSNKILLLGLLLVTVVGAVAVEFVSVQEAAFQHTGHTVNAGELTRGVLVGQTFLSQRDNLSGVAVMFATYSNRTNTEPIVFHLRQSLDSREDVRTAHVYPSELGDNQLYRFTFEPIPDSANKTYFFYVVSPTSREGNAVTVDLDTRDPYHLGSAFIARGGELELTDPQVIARSGKPTVDVVFGLYHTVPLRVAVVNEVRQTAREFVVTWDERQGRYLLWAELAAAIGAFVLLMIGLRSDPAQERQLSPRTVAVLLTSLFVVGVLFRLLYATTMPITNDEGNYLYDAWMVREGVLAGGDGYVKAPLVIVWLSLWQFVFGNTVLAGRLAMIVVSAATLVPLYSIGRYMYSQRAGVLAAGAWALFGAPAVFGIYVHTQAVAIFFGAAGIALLWKALRQDVVSNRWLLAAGLLLGLGVASRKSVLALGLVPLALILLESYTWRQRLSRLVMVGIGFLFIVAALLGWAWYAYGEVGVVEALGLNSAEDGINAVDPAEAEQVRTYSLRGMTPFFRESLPLIFLSVLGWGLLLESFVRRQLRGLVPVELTKRTVWWLEHVVPKLAWLLPAAVLWWEWQFFFEYEGDAFLLLGGMMWLWYAMVALVVVVALWPRAASEAWRFSGAEEALVAKSTQPAAAAPRNTIAPSNVIGGGKQQVNPKTVDSDLPVSWRHQLTGVLAAPLWIGGLIFFYMNWIKFHANYIVEFLPPLALLSGVGAYLAWQRLRGPQDLAEAHPVLVQVPRLVAVVFVAVLLWGGYLSNYITYYFEHTGTFDQSSVREAAAWAQQNIPSDQPIFTGAAVVPYLSGHRTVLDIAHPRWYAYQWIREDTERISAFLPPAEEMLQAYREAEWFMLERQTGFSFLMEYSEIEAGLERDWQVVHEVENLSNPLVFYRRIR